MNGRSGARDMRQLDARSLTHSLKTGSTVSRHNYSTYCVRCWANAPPGSGPLLFTLLARAPGCSPVAARGDAICQCPFTTTPSRDFNLEQARGLIRTADGQNRPATSEPRSCYGYICRTHGDCGHAPCEPSSLRDPQKSLPPPPPLRTLTFA